MIINRSKNTIRNVKYGLINRILNTILPFITRTVFIHTLGANYLGLNSLFSSILAVLNMTELGFSSAIVFSMYKPIAEDDVETINALLLLYRKVYRYVGTIILCIGLLLIPFLPHLINGEYPASIHLTTVYLIYLGNTVLSYFMFAYLSAIITAHQREDLVSKVGVFLSIFKNAIEIVTLIFTKNYYCFILIMPLFTVLKNIRTALIAKIKFPQFSPCGHLEKDQVDSIREKINGLAIQKICSISRNSFDSIFISAFLGLTITAKYNNYYYVLTGLIALMAILSSAVTAGVGNSIAIASPEKNYNDFNRMNFIYMWISSWATVCLLCLYQPFMRLWMGEAMLFPNSIAILFCLYFFLLKMIDIRYVYSTASGIWWHERYRSIAEATANFLLNWLLGRFFGVYGILCATLISLFVINYCWGSQIVFKHYFIGISPNEYYIRNLFYLVATSAAAALTYFVCAQIRDTGIPTLMLKALICIIIPNILLFCFYFKTKYYKESVPWFLSRLKMSIHS